MIPLYTVSDVLPPFIGDNVTVSAAMSPFRSDMLAVVNRFATSPERIAILRGLFTYRESLLAVGVEQGFQWLSGSFFEDVEKIRGRAPADVDIVTFGFVPALYGREDVANAFIEANLDLFTAAQTKSNFMCDAYFVDLNQSPESVVDDTRYWFGLFSHQRETSLWKGMIHVALDDSSEVDAMKLLEARHAENA